MKNFILAIALSFAPGLALADDWPQWRGPERNGHSRETGLLKEWPKDGPKLRWKATDLGSGYSTPSVVGDRIFLLANKGLENEFVVALKAQDGSPAWTARLGNVGNPKQQPNFASSRSTPTVDGDLVFALGSDGDLACLEKDSGKPRWKKNLRADFGGQPGNWAYSESPLIDGDTLVITPGGATATIVGLNKKTGDVLWKTPLPNAGAAGFASAIALETAGARQYVQLLEKGLFGLDARNGQLLWHYSKPVSKYGANIPSPLASDNIIFVASAGTGAGAVKLKSANSKIETEELYFEASLPTAIGGAVKVGDLLFGTTAQALKCIDFATGKVLWEERALGAASLCYADNRLYLHGENGEVALIEPAREGYREKGRFTPPNLPGRASPMEKAWTYPIIANGTLYIRDLDTLWAYNIAAADKK